MFCPQCGANNGQEAKFCAGCGAPLALAAEPAINHPATSPTTPRFAGFWFRTLAAVIDTVLCQVATVILAGRDRERFLSSTRKFDRLIRV